ncbi:MAG: aspartate kinase [Nitrososphaerota archaeon]
MSLPDCTAAGTPLGRVVGVLLVQRNPVVLDYINIPPQFLPPLKSVGFFVALQGEAGIITDSNFGEANPLMEITSHQVKSKIIPLLNKGQIVVVTGFIAENQDGEITTLGRGGSDYTATILASALGANKVFIWTDVDGIMTADPKIVPEARIVPHLSFQEAIESAVFGAKKMHPKALEPAMLSNIPVVIKNVFNPSVSGTLISSESANGRPIKLVNLIKNVALINVRGGGMVGAPGTAAKVFQTVAKDGINILMISQSVSESDISFVIRREELSRARSSLEISLLGTGLVREITNEDDICIISAVGAAIKDTPGIASRLFSALAKENINVRMIAQGSSELNISLVVKEKDGIRAVKSIHKEFALFE